jgi:hypothetical protein
VAGKIMASTMTKTKYRKELFLSIRVRTGNQVKKVPGGVNSDINRRSKEKNEVFQEKNEVSYFQKK